jgi:alpha-beta hydrolase superfamily lysophospholipase
MALHSDDGLALHLSEWPAAGTACGTVLVVHGLGEHIGRYAQLAADLSRAGWHVVGYDQRGHGTSGGARGFIPQHDSLLLDLARAVQWVMDAQRPGPLVLLGHSMGGTVAARFVASLADDPAHHAPAWQRSARAIDALVLSSPALDAGLGPWRRLQLVLAAALVPGVALGNGLNPADLSRDPRVVQAYISDPLVHDRITPRLARFIVEAGAQVRAHAAAWRTPTLLLWAGADRIVAPRGSAAFAAAAPADTLHAHCFADLAHEIFNEPERAEVVAELLRWLEAR